MVLLTAFSKEILWGSLKAAQRHDCCHIKGAVPSFWFQPFKGKHQSVSNQSMAKRCTHIHTDQKPIIYNQSSVLAVSWKPHISVYNMNVNTLRGFHMTADSHWQCVGPVRTGLFWPSPVWSGLVYFFRRWESLSESQSKKWPSVSGTSCFDMRRPGPGSGIRQHPCAAVVGPLYP